MSGHLKDFIITFKDQSSNDKTSLLSSSLRKGDLSSSSSSLSNESKKSYKKSSKPSKPSKSSKSSKNKDDKPDKKNKSSLKKIGNVKFYNPRKDGHLNMTQHRDFIYIGSNDEIQICKILGSNDVVTDNTSHSTSKEIKQVSQIKLPGFAPRARVKGNYLFAIANTHFYIFDNSNPLWPRELGHFDVGSEVIDFILDETSNNNDNNDKTAYILCQERFVKLTFSLNVNRQDKPEVDSFHYLSMHSDLDATLVQKLNIVYAAGPEKGHVHVIDVSGQQPRMIEDIDIDLMPITLDIPEDKPDLLVVGCIFGLAFLDISKLDKPVIINQYQSRYLNLIKVLPQGRALNVIFGPQNYMLLGKIVKHGKKYKFDAESRIDIQNGRLPWSILVLDKVTDSNSGNSLHVANNSNYNDSKEEIKSRSLDHLFKSKSKKGFKKKDKDYNNNDNVVIINDANLIVASATNPCNNNKFTALVSNSIANKVEIFKIKIK